MALLRVLLLILIEALFKSLMRLSGQTYETYAASMSTKYCPLRRRLHCAIVRILAIRQYSHSPLLDVDEENILLFYINRAQSPLYSRGKSKKKGEERFRVDLSFVFAHTRPHCSLGAMWFTSWVPSSPPLKGHPDSPGSVFGAELVQLSF